MASENAKAVAQEIFIQDLRDLFLSGQESPYIARVKDTIDNGTYEELGWLLAEIDRVISGLKATIHEVRPKKYYKIRQPEDRANINLSLRYDILKRDGFRCKCCGREPEDGIKLHVDHIMPFSKGGKTREDNLRTLCMECNLGKKDKI